MEQQKKSFTTTSSQQITLEIQVEPMDTTTSIQQNTPPAPNEIPNEEIIKQDKHWDLRPGLAIYIEDAIKEIYLEITHQPLDNLERMALWDLEINDCFNEAKLSNLQQTEQVLKEWFPLPGDWDLFFPTMYLLKSVSHYLNDDHLSTSFRGFTLEEAKTLLQLDFQPPPNSCSISGKWDLPKKRLAQHLVTKMDQMRNSQGYPSMIIHAHFENLSLPMEDQDEAERLNLD